MCSGCLEAAYTGPGAGVGSGLLWMVEMVGRGSTVGTHSPATLHHHILTILLCILFVVEPG